MLCFSFGRGGVRFEWCRIVFGGESRNIIEQESTSRASLVVQTIRRALKRFLSLQRRTIPPAERHFYLSKAIKSLYFFNIAATSRGRNRAVRGRSNTRKHITRPPFPNIVETLN